jgi:hypothetical protein
MVTPESGAEPTLTTPTDDTPVQLTPTPSSGAAITPPSPAKDDKADTTQVTPPTPSEASLNFKTVDELIAAIPEERLASLNAQEIDALTSGDRTAVARMFNLPPAEPAAPPTPTPTPKVVAQAPDLTDPKHVERISLRGIPQGEATQITDIVIGLKTGKFKSLQEALGPLAPTAATQTAAKAQEPSAPPADKEPEPDDEPLPTTNETIDALTAEIAKLTQDLKEAGPTFDMVKIGEIAAEVGRAKAELKQATKALEAQNASIKSARHDFDTGQQVAFATIVKSHPDLLDDDAPLSVAFRDARDLALHRNDPVMQKGNWPEVILGRVAKTAAPQQPPARAPLPTPPPADPRGPKGEVVVPNGATPTMSPAEVDAILDDDNNSEEFYDNLLKGIKDRERAKALGGRL